MSNRLFTSIPVPRFPSSTFSLSAGRGFGARLMKLYAPEIIETLPGDGINIRTEQFSRTMPMVAPSFAKINADQFSFFVPSWQLHEKFDDFITGGEKGDFQEKMPFFRVTDMHSLLTNLLYYHWRDHHTFGPNSYVLYNKCLELVQNIMEHCDLIRAIPFVLPDFVPASSDMTSAQFNSLVSSNTDAYLAENKFGGVSLRVNYLPFGAYLKVWSEFFRDENLVDDYFDLFWKGSSDLIRNPVYEHTGYLALSNLFQDFTWADDIALQQFLPAIQALFGVLPRAWRKDYFTAALPFVQKGPDVLLPIGGVFPVDVSKPSGTAEMESVLAVTASAPAARPGGLYVEPGNEVNKLGLSVDLSPGRVGATIQDVRRAFALEEFYEADGRGGNRYPENTLMQFGVRTPDSRLPRCQFLGSNSSPVQISEVVQNSESGTTPQGNLAGKAVSYGSNRLARFYSSMHGFIVCLFSLQLRAVYESGIHPMFSRYDRTEYAWPRFAHLGEQPVYTKELFVSPGTTEDEVFGYEPRYSEYKSDRSSVHGVLKGSLNFWTMSRRFQYKPVLNKEFIYNPPRLDSFVINNPLTPPFICEVDYRVRANRKLPFFGVPSL